MSERPSPKSALVSEAMRRMPEEGTSPELDARQSLYRKGLRYRIQYPVPGFSRRTIDIAFPGAKVAVFIDGCFWHGCTAHRTIPANNNEWWKNKISQNRSRDCETDLRLRKDGWIVLRFWEHDPLEQITSEVNEAVRLQRKPKERKNQVIHAPE